VRHFRSNPELLSWDLINALTSLFSHAIITCRNGLEHRRLQSELLRESERECRAKSSLRSSLLRRNVPLLDAHSQLPTTRSFDFAALNSNSPSRRTLDVSVAAFVGRPGHKRSHQLSHRLLPDPAVRYASTPRRTPEYFGRNYNIGPLSPSLRYSLLF
jgi:hypothetical protein